MEIFKHFIQTMEHYVWDWPPQIPLMVVLLLAFGFYITIRLGFIQFKGFRHGIKVVTGFYDDPDDEGDINHFQALTTALSGTVGTGNIVGVALAIHFGGPGALFWMWVTALFGMAIKYSEVTLAQKYRSTNPDGTVSGGPMYYIERGLGDNWKWLAVAFSVSAGICAFLTGNAVQANSVSDIMQTSFQIPFWVTGLVTATLVGAVVLGGIKRIGKVTSRLVPLMGALYVAAALLILGLNYETIIPAFKTIVSSAFDPVAGAYGVGSGAFIFTLSYGVQRGIFSNEAGQGSAPIAHSAARTDEPVREGVVALLEPFIDTLVICTMTGLVIVTTGAWDAQHPSGFSPSSDQVKYEVTAQPAHGAANDKDVLYFSNGLVENGNMMHNGAPVDTMYTNSGFSTPFTGRIDISGDNPIAYNENGNKIGTLYGNVVRTGAPLTSAAFQRGLSPLIPGGNYLVTFAVFLFAVSTSISWSYYGDRAAQYILGFESIFYYRLVYVAMHFVGAIASLAIVWSFGDVMLGLMAFFNIIGLFALSGTVYKVTEKYFGTQHQTPES